MIRIDYFDFIELFPQIMDDDFLYYPSNKIIHFFKKTYDVLNEDTPVLKIDFSKLSDLVFLAKSTKGLQYEFLTNSIIIELHKKEFFRISQDNDYLIYERNNRNEIFGNFNIKKDYNRKVHYIDNIEKENIKRSILIDSMIDE